MKKIKVFGVVTGIVSVVVAVIYKIKNKKQKNDNKLYMSLTLNLPSKEELDKSEKLWCDVCSSVSAVKCVCPYLYRVCSFVLDELFVQTEVPVSDWNVCGYNEETTTIVYICAEYRAVSVCTDYELRLDIYER